MDITVTTNVSQALAGLTAIQRRIEAALVAGTEDGTSYLERQLTTYPAKRPGSAYVRTGTLRGSWDVTAPVVSGDTVSARVFSNGNVAPYNVLVQRHATQAAVHRGLWTNTDENVRRRSEGPINAMFAARIAAAVG